MGAIVISSITLSDVENGMRALRENASSIGRVFRALAPHARRDMLGHGRKKEGPDGPWPARSASYLEKLREQAQAKKRRIEATKASGKRTRARARIIPLMGRIPRSIRMRVAGDALIGRSMIKWAEAHRDGSTVGRGVNLPQRDFLWWPPEFLDLAAQTIEDYIIEPWKRGASASSIKVGFKPDFRGMSIT